MRQRVRPSADLRAVPCHAAGGQNQCQPSSPLEPVLTPIPCHAAGGSGPVPPACHAVQQGIGIRASPTPRPQAMFAVGCQGPPAPTPSSPVPCSRGSGSVAAAAAPPADLGQLCAMGPGSEPAGPPQAPYSCGGWKATVRSPPAVPPAPRRKRCAIRSELLGQPFARVQARPGAPRARGELGARPAGRGEGRGSRSSAEPPSQTGAAGPRPKSPVPAASHLSSS